MSCNKFNMVSLLLLILTSFNMVSAHEQRSNSYTMPKDVLSNGGDKSSSSGYQMVATVGQYATQKVAANGSTLYSGFYSPRTRSSKSTKACGGITEGLVACYPFDGNANDASGNGNDGTEHGGFSYVTGKIGQAAQFDGINDYVEVPSGNNLNPAQITVSAWIKISDVSQVTAPHNHHIVFYMTRQYELAVFGSSYPNNQWSDGIQPNELSFALNPHWYWYSTDYFPQKHQFEHVTLTFDEKMVGTLYINGEYVHETQYSNPMSPNPNCLMIGARTCPPSKAQAFFNGLIDDLRIYNRVLSKSEIKQLYNPTCGGVTEGLVACYPFDGNANDYSGNGNHGILQSGVSFVEGKIREAASFDGGNNAYIRIPHTDTQKFDDQFSMAGWVLSNGKGGVIFNKYTWAAAGGGGKGFGVSGSDELSLASSGSAVSGYARFNTSYGGEENNWPVSQISPGQFHYFTVTYNNSQIKLYINAELKSEKNIPFAKTLDNSYDMLIGAFFTNNGKRIYPGSFFNGLLDELRVYNRALSESEIKQLYNSKEEPCKPELSVEPLYKVLNWGQRNTTFELENKTDCAMEWNIKTNLLSISPNSGKNSQTLEATMTPSFWFKVGTFMTTASDAVESPANNILVQPGLWWWWQFWTMQEQSGTLHPDEHASHFIPIDLIMRGPMIFRVTWPGSDLDLKITTPSGKVLTKDSPEVLNVYEGDTEEHWVVDSKETGNWQVDVIAIEVDPEGEPYKLSVIGNKRNEPPTEDTDGDGLPDEWETYFLGDLTQDGTDDSDKDGVSNLREYQENLNPTSEDTDGDGKLDGQEIENYTTLGTLKDKTGNPIAGATIEIDGQTTITDAAGNWEIPNLSEGEYTLNASKEGFAFLPQTIELGNQKYLQSVELKPLSELGLWVKPATRQPLKQGQNQRYTATVVNGGENTATGVTLSETLPEGSTLVSLTTVDGGDCDAQTLTCQLPDLSTGQSARVTIEITDLPPNSLRNMVTVSSNEYPEDVKKTWNHVDPYLSVQISDQPDPVLLKGKLHYELAVDLNEYASNGKATGIELTSRLPQGTQLDNVSTDDGQCVHEAGVIICAMDDLSIANAADKSHATVNVDVILQDAGLLVLNHEATVKANGYPSDMHREKTKVFVGDTQVDMVLVLDTTHSMHEEINGVIKALKAFIKEKMTNNPMQVALIEFKDDVLLRAFSSDMETLLQAVEKLEVSGGGTCPEASVEALNLAVDHLKDSGVIFFSTDASPYEEANIDTLYERIQDKKIQVTAVISGDCSEGETSWNDIQ